MAIQWSQINSSRFTALYSFILTKIWVKFESKISILWQKNTILRQKTLISIKKTPIRLANSQSNSHSLLYDQFITLHCTLFIHLVKNLSENQLLPVSEIWAIVKKSTFVSEIQLYFDTSKLTILNENRQFCVKFNYILSQNRLLFFQKITFFSNFEQFSVCVQKSLICVKNYYFVSKITILCQ